MFSPRPVRALKPPDTPLQHWQLIRDQRVREAEVKAEIELARLEEDAKVLVERRGQVETELDRMGESEAGVKAHRTLAKWWGAGFVLASLVMMLSAWWTLNWYLSLTWEKALLALTLFILPLIGWAAFLLFSKQKTELSWRLTCGLGLAVVILSLLATALLGAGRMAGVLLEEDRQQATAAMTQGELGPAADPGPSVLVLRVKKFLAVATMVSVILIAIAGEIAAGLAFHEYYRRMTVAWTVWPYYREQAALAQAIADNLAHQEEVKRRPQLLHAQLTASGLMAEATQIEGAAAEARAAITRAADEARLAAEAEKKANSLGRVVKIVLVAGLVAVLILLGVAAMVFAEERQVDVVILDLSASMAGEEFRKNIRAVEGIITLLAPESRFVVLGVTESSFSTPPIYVQTSPRNSGRFGEYLGTWRTKAVREWRLVAERLRPSAKGSDLLGALARASTEFEEVRGASKKLTILSDMRHVGRGLNLENGHPRLAMSSLDQHGLVTPLAGVEVWMLGVHTAGSDIEHWQGLKAFWTQYFQKSGAAVKAFSPNRRGPAS